MAQQKYQQGNYTYSLPHLVAPWDDARLLAINLEHRATPFSVATWFSLSRLLASPARGCERH